MPFGGLLTVGIIGAAAGLGSAAIQSHQAGKAVQAQTAAGDKALALQGQIYNQTRDDLAPYRTLGGMAITGSGGLNALMGWPNSAPAAPSTVGSSLGTMGGNAGIVTVPNQAQAAGGGGYLGQTPAQAATNASATSYPGYALHSSPVGTVTMIGPDGSTQQVPGDQVPYWEGKGAKVVHG